MKNWLEELNPPQETRDTSFNSSTFVFFLDWWCHKIVVIVKKEQTQKQSSKRYKHILSYMLCRILKRERVFSRILISLLFMLYHHLFFFVIILITYLSFICFYNLIVFVFITIIIVIVLHVHYYYIIISHILLIFCHNHDDIVCDSFRVCSREETRLLNIQEIDLIPQKTQTCLL